MNRIIEVVNIENPNDLIVRQVTDAQVHSIGEKNPPDFDLHVAKRGQNADKLVQRIRQNNVGGIIILLE